jgi:hypothetical protein
MFNDPDFQVRSSVDKRGRKVESKKRSEDLRRFYRLKDEEDWRQEGAQQEGAQQEGAQPEQQPKAGRKAAAAGKQQTQQTQQKQAANGAAAKLAGGR